MSLRLSHGLILAALVVSAARADSFDLTGLARYQPPAQKVTGTIRNWGNDTMADLVKVWETRFQAYHPDVRFADNLKTTAIALPALTTGLADLGTMGREVVPVENISFLKFYGHAPLIVTVASGTFDVDNKTWAFTVFVHRDNPIRGLTLRQLDGIFGRERTGGWDETATKWLRSRARGPEGNIRTWGQVGLTGEWADKPIHTYGFDLSGSGFSYAFEQKVLGGGDKWNENLKEFVALKKPDGTTLGAPPQVTAALGGDPYGIAYDGPQYRTDRVRPVPIAARDGGPFVEATKASVQNLSYPPYRSVYLVLPRDPSRPVEPKLREFLRFVLSREGQQAVAETGEFLPLTPRQAAEQLAKLD